MTLPAREAHLLREDTPGVGASLLITAAAAQADALTPEVRDLAHAALRAAEQEGDTSDLRLTPEHQARAIWRYLVDGDLAVYTGHHIGIDEMPSAALAAHRMLAGGQARIDCAGFLRLFGALLTAVGAPWRVVGAALGDERIDHTWVEVFTPGGWLPMDPCVPRGQARFGWRLAAAGPERIRLAAEVPTNLLDVPDWLIEGVQSLDPRDRSGGLSAARRFLEGWPVRLRDGWRGAQGRRGAGAAPAKPTTGFDWGGGFVTTHSTGDMAAPGQQDVDDALASVGLPTGETEDDMSGAGGLFGGGGGLGGDLLGDVAGAFIPGGGIAVDLLGGMLGGGEDPSLGGGGAAPGRPGGAAPGGAPQQQQSPQQATHSGMQVVQPPITPEINVTIDQSYRPAAGLAHHCATHSCAGCIGGHGGQPPCGGAARIF